MKRESLLRGPLILTTVSRVLSIPFYFVCAMGATFELKGPRSHTVLFLDPILAEPKYPMELILLTTSMWVFMLFNVLLAWLFFARRRMFRPVVVYYTLFLPTFLECVGMHTGRSPMIHLPDRPQGIALTALAYGLAAVFFSIPFWPFYYFFSPRLKRVFTR